MREYEKLFERIDLSEDEYKTFWKELCLIESPTDCKEGVDAVGNYIIEKAMARGWKIEKQEQKISGDCICITMNPDAEGKSICLSGHMDTVHPIGLFGDHPVKIDEDIIYGPGVSDCKGGIVAAFMAMAALDDEGFSARPVKLILQSDEETSSDGSNKTTVQYMCECARDAVAFLNCEPYVMGTAVLKRKGIAKYTFKIKGKAEHAAYCYNGISAITEAAHKIIELEKYKDENGITANCGKIYGGTKTNTVPEECVFKVDFRFSNSDELSEIKNIAQRVADTSYIEGTTCELILESFRDAMELTDKNTALLEKANEIFASTGLVQLSPRSTGGGSDAAYTTNCGIPTIDSIGVELGNIHSKNEYASVSSLKEAAKRIAAICYYI
ncbi:MAG: M20 family metallopeptidase [Ruminococcaceae bacterium]|nr:M20 family metallopeptidase [Oscillospiraceae bacterium]